MPAGGGAAGIAGLAEVAGPIGQLSPTISPGYGFAAIIVAFVGRLHPVGIVLAAFVMALFYIGGELAQSRLGLPSALTGVYQGLLLFFLLGADVLINYRLRVVWPVRAGLRQRGGMMDGSCRSWSPPWPRGRHWYLPRWGNSSWKSRAS
jgi:ABC-type uncharacterized transport system permease subunit